MECIVFVAVCVIIGSCEDCCGDLTDDQIDEMEKQHDAH